MLLSIVCQRHAESPELCRLAKRGGYAAARRSQHDWMPTWSPSPSFRWPDTHQLLPDEMLWFSTSVGCDGCPAGPSKGITEKSGYQGSRRVKRDRCSEKHQRTPLWSRRRCTWLPCQTASWELIKYFIEIQNALPEPKLAWGRERETCSSNRHKLLVA